VVSITLCPVTTFLVEKVPGVAFITAAKSNFRSLRMYFAKRSMCVLMCVKVLPCVATYFEVTTKNTTQLSLHIDHTPPPQTCGHCDPLSRTTPVNSFRSATEYKVHTCRPPPYHVTRSSPIQTFTSRYAIPHPKFKGLS
jgi:hypothetical protein